MKFLSFGFFVYYFTKVFLYEYKADNYGPLPDDKRTVREVIREDNGNEVQMLTYEQPVTLLEKVRQVANNPYEIMDDDGEEIWFVKERRIQVWKCPKCLSFWVAAIIGIYVLYTERSIGKAVFAWGAAAGFSTFLHTYESLLDAQAIPEIEDVDLS